MIVIFFLLTCVVGGFYLFRAMFDLLVPKETFEETTSKTTHINHNYITENHLHISKEDLKALSDKKN